MVRKKDVNNTKFYNVVWIVLSIFLVGIFFSNRLISQTKISLHQTTIYDQNTFRNYQEIPDYVNQTSVYFAHDFKIKVLQLYVDYYGDLFLFRNYQDRLFHVHQFEIGSIFSLNFNLRSHIGINYQLRRNKSEYNIYDYSNWSTYFQFIFVKWQHSPIEIGYRFDNKLFNNLAELNYSQHVAFLNIKHFFPTKTTFIGQIDFATKKYTNQQTPEKLIISTNNRSGGSRWHRHGMGYGTTPADTAIVAYNMTIPQTQQWSLVLKLAQSIFSTTGLSIQYQRRFKPSETSRYLTGQEYTYVKEDELYDDPLSYSSHEWETVMTQVLPWSSQLKIYAYFQNKKYSYSIIDDLNHYRRDQVKSMGINLSKKIELNRVIRNTSTYIYYYYLINNSNEPYFDYRGYLFYVGFDLNF